MTQEEKARAYDEALERAMVLRQEAIDKGYALDYIKDYETIFPELAESEDERIRKELIEAFEVYDIESSWNLIPVKHILDWLERQKEQAPVERSREDNYIIGFVYALLNQIEWKDNWAMSKEECLRRLNNYIPQKPVEVRAEEIRKVKCGKCYWR